MLGAASGAGWVATRACTGCGSSETTWLDLALGIDDFVGAVFFLRDAADGASDTSFLCFVVFFVDRAGPGAMRGEQEF